MAIVPGSGACMISTSSSSAPTSPTLTSPKSVAACPSPPNKPSRTGSAAFPLPIRYVVVTPPEVRDCDRSPSNSM